MLITINRILGRPIEGDDGQLGTVADLLFDSYTWDVRYLVVETGGWLPGRQVLLAPETFHDANWDDEHLVLRAPLTKRQIEDSPSIDADQPVSRQQEFVLAEYFGWTGYWSEGGVAGSPAPVGIDAVPTEKKRGEEAAGDPDLRSSREVIGYFIEATDGDIGHVDDFVLDVQSWIIRYLIIKTRNWLPGRFVLISPAWTEAIHWSDRHVRVHLTRAELEASPEFDPRQPIERRYEEQLHQSYGRPRYWLW